MPGVGLVGDLHVEVEQEADRLLLDALHHRGEHVVGLALVFHDRVALAVAAQTDALLQVVHLVEVLAPLAVEHGQDDPALELVQYLGAELLLPALVRRQGVLSELLDHELAGERAT